VLTAAYHPFAEQQNKTFKKQKQNTHISKLGENKAIMLETVPELDKHQYIWGLWVS
jgi:hypothetical protein